MAGNCKHILKSKFKYVNLIEWRGGVRKWQAQIGYLKWTKFCDTEREAAKAVDIKLIMSKKEPVNILVRKAI